MYAFIGDKHGAVIMPPDSVPPALGERVVRSAPHCDPRVNLYDTYHVIQGETLRSFGRLARGAEHANIDLSDTITIV